MKKILITGMPYSGKSYLAEYLSKLGIHAVDADTIKGLGKWYDKNNIEVVFSENANTKWLENHKFIWDIKFLKQWLNKQNSDIYLFGISDNIFDMIDLFDKAYYLELTPEIFNKRINKNNRSNPMGLTQEQQKSIIEKLNHFNKKAKELGLTKIDANRTPEKIIEILKTIGKND